MVLDKVLGSGNRPDYVGDGGAGSSVYYFGGGSSGSGGSTGSYSGAGGNNGNTNNNGPPSSTDDGTYFDSYWVWFGLFIATPCLRALYLLWAGGGRHSEEEGNPVVGFQYIPPMDNSLDIYEPTDANRIHDQLTQQQVLDLPEIAYTKPYDDDDDDNDDNEYIDNVNDNDHNDNDDTNSGTNITATTSNDTDTQSMEGEPRLNWYLSPISSERETLTFTLPPLPTSPERVTSISTNITNTAPTSIPKEEMTDEEQPPEAPLSFRTQRRLRSFTTTTCTTCSICIDEFEEGEKIRLLPLCGHAFHTECISPWLTERQGCCPLCKMGVLENTVNNNSNALMTMV